MLKKVFLCVVTLVMLLSSVSLVYADNLLEKENRKSRIIAPRFSNIVSAVIDLRFNGSTAQQSVEVRPYSRDSIDYITVNGELLKNTTTVKTWYKKVDKKDLTMGGYFLAAQDHKVSSRGVYKLHVVVKCYKNGVVVDKFDDYSGNVTY